jgi:hypothetical protein
LLIAVPQEVAPITSVGKEKSLGCVACEVAVIPPGKERTGLSFRANQGDPSFTGVSSQRLLSNILHLE